MSAPTPAPRTLLSESKKPIPAPRTMVPIKPEQEKSTDIDGKNTFSRRVRTLSSASRQIAGDIGDKVQEGKKAVIESTRQSVRKITRRFTNNFSEAEQVPDLKQDNSDVGSDIDLFNSIRFNSPIHLQEAIYNNIDQNEQTSIEDDEDQPPPPYPPPPLREEVYDKPQSITSGSTNSSEGPPPFRRNPYDYESIFPIYPYNSDSESCVDMTAGTIDRKVDLSRSESWNFYDALPVSQQERQEPVYKNVDSTPVLESQKKSFIRNNSLYENHMIMSPPPPRPTKSVIMEFDPLSNNDNNHNVQDVDELGELEKILQGDLYGNVSTDNLSVYDDASDSDDVYISPPPPPARFDSLADEPPIQPTASPAKTDKSKTHWFTSADPQGKPAESKPYKWLKQMNEVLKKAPDLVKSKNKESLVQRPSLLPKGIIQQKGMLFKITSGPVEDLFGEFSSRWCVLQSGSFVCYSDNNCDAIKEQFPMDSVLSVQILQDQKFKYKCENDELHCFELNIAGKSRGGHVYGSKSISERRVWLQKLAESLTCRFGPKITTDFSRIGWGYIKEGLSGQWMGAWLVLAKRKLLYAVDNCPVKSLDLRKARCFALEPLTESSPCTTDKGPNIVIHFTSGTFYFRMWTHRETKVWCHIIKLSAQNNGAKLDQQQLTKNDIPVIVEKCINFVYAYGSMAEGVYRRSGSNGTVADLMTQFRQDAWSVQLTDKYSNHDVANALKRFFRELAEPLIDSNKRQYLYQVSLVKSKDDRVRMYKGIFDQMSPIVYNTCRRLLGHLHFISTQSEKNLMNVENLAAIWGPTLLHHEFEDDDDCSKDHVIVAHLINLYKFIFPEDAKEAEQEQKMLSVLEKCSLSPQGAVNVKSSGDFRVWIYLYNKEGRTFNLLIGPQRTAYEVLCELSPKINVPVHELVLEELVLNDNLTRPIHHTEKLLDVVLKWGYWDDNDRKDNCIILNNISKYWEYMHENALPLSAELKYADSKTKHFKSFTFEFLQAKLSYYKDKSCSIKLGTWNIEDLNWYFGNENKRSPPTKYTITFIDKHEKPLRTKSTPWFGNIICWTEPSLRALWLASMWRAEHPNDLTPPPQHVNLMMS